jgi:hypothetical protein
MHSHAFADPVRILILLASLDIFSRLFSANIAMQATQHTMLQTMNSQRAEMQALLDKILGETSEQQHVITMQNSGQHVAEDIMEAGQTVCEP